MASMRKICIVVGSRANYASIKSVLLEVQAHAELELQLVVSSSALLDRYGAVVEVIRADGLQPAEEILSVVEGDTPEAMVLSTGLGLVKLSSCFHRLRPDCVLTVGDRFETMATAIAAAYMNIPLAHTMGGEVSGTIDESVRHAISKLANIHFPANELAAQRLVRMGEDPAKVFVVGCPRIDLAADIASSDKPKGLDDILRVEGVGSGPADLSRPFLLVAQYPVTSEFEQARQQIEQTLLALRDLELPKIMLWPNPDAGSEGTARGIRVFRERHDNGGFRFYKNFPPEEFLYLVSRAACVVGNSSAGIREAAYFGTPVVNIGSRQAGRDRAPNVIDTNYSAEEISAAVRRQLTHGRYEFSDLYGRGDAGRQIAQVLASVELQSQKQLQLR